MSEIIWNVEPEKVDRNRRPAVRPAARPIARPIARPPAIPRARSRTQIRLQKIQEIIAQGQFEERLAMVGIWFRLALVGALATSLFWWPYAHGCGFGLSGFLAAQVVVIVGGSMLAIRAWRDRLPWAFGSAALFIGIAWTVIAVQTLPRMGYSPAPLSHAGWVCGD